MNRIDLEAMTPTEIADMMKMIDDYRQYVTEMIDKLTAIKAALDGEPVERKKPVQIKVAGSHDQEPAVVQASKDVAWINGNKYSAGNRVRVPGYTSARRILCNGTVVATIARLNKADWQVYSYPDKYHLGTTRNIKGSMLIIDDHRAKARGVAGEAVR